MPATKEHCREYRRRLRARAYAVKTDLFSDAPQCEHCGASEADGAKLEFAHTRPTSLRGEGRGQSRRHLDVIRNQDSYRLLCDDCHRALDGRRARSAADAVDFGI